MATQNPIEQEGTYPLPEAQLDRFLLHVKIDYPDAESERQILNLVRGEALARSKHEEAQTIKISQQEIMLARQEVLQIHMADAVEDYIINLTMATRNPGMFSPELARWIEFGVSPRGTLALDRCARAHAWLNGKDYVSPDDVSAVLHDTFRHRVLLSFDAEAEGQSVEGVLEHLLASVPVA
jgi:MoxR-like ATPase